MTTASIIEQNDSNYFGAQPIPTELFTSGEPTAKVWVAHSFESGSNIRTGIWVGEPGSINVPAYPEDEVFTVLSGRIELAGQDGSTIGIGPGESCLVRRGWVGTWTNVEQTRKCFVIMSA